jgi:polysaccharide biosynthesis transport protein
MINDSETQMEGGLTVAPAPGSIVGYVNEAHARGANPLHRAHSALRGRYWIASILALVGAPIGALVAYHLVKPQFESTGIIMVKPTLPPVLYTNDQNNLLPMFGAYVEAQAALIGSQRVIELGMQNPQWTAIHPNYTPDDVVNFTNSLTVTHTKDGELIIVAFDDIDPDVAQRAVGCVIDAYQQVYNEDDSGAVQQRLNVLEERRLSLTNDLKGLNDRMNAIATEYGSNTLDKVYEFKLDQLNEMERQLNQTEIAAAEAQEAPAGGQQAAPDQGLVQRFPQLTPLLNLKNELSMRLSALAIDLGDQHPQVLKTKAQLAEVQSEIDQITKSAAASGGTAMSPDVPGAEKTKAELQAQSQEIRKLYEKALAETQDLGRKCVELQTLRTDAESKDSQLKEATARIDALNLESSIGGRITVESRGNHPLAPVKNKQIIAAVGGGLGMAGLGLACVLVAGLLDRRVRHISDVADHMAPGRRILGVLPQLPDDLTDPVQAAWVSQVVHQVRTMLQQRRTQTDKTLLGITSASPGAGKTSLTIALGLSYAASGSETLLIDCDIIGGGLTSKMNKMIHRRLGRMLLREGRITSEQLRSAVEEARRSGRRLGEILVDAGLVAKEEIEQILQKQTKTNMGLREALDGDPIDECVVASGTPGLWTMPLGSADPRHASQLTYAALLRIIQQCRGRFDAIIIDTGPILGSLEGPVATLVADEVVLMVARGDQQPLVQRAVDFLESNGANLVGVVLNRADPADIATSQHSGSASRRSTRDSGWVPDPTLPVDKHRKQFGVVGAAVAAFTNDSESPHQNG